MKTYGLVSKSQLAGHLSQLKSRKKKLVFTNGVFDILHRGHVEFLQKAKSFGDILVVGINTDSSVKRIKGPKRPIQNQFDRAVILSALKSVDFVVFFSEDTPHEIIEFVKPDVLVKGADYRRDEIVGADFVIRHGGVVKRIKLTSGRSTSRILKML